MRLGKLTEEEFRIDHPRMSLEEFFLDVVNRAQAESVETYGARSGGQIADYLSGGSSENEEELKAKKELLDSLTKPDEKAAQQQPEPIKNTDEAAINNEKLDGLSDDLLKTKEEKPVEPEPVDVDLSEANAKLKNMLSGLDRKD